MDLPSPIDGDSLKINNVGKVFDSRSKRTSTTKMKKRNAENLSYAQNNVVRAPQQNNPHPSAALPLSLRLSHSVVVVQSP